MNDRLFDMTEYGGAELTAKEQRAAKPRKVRIDYPVEPLQPGWTVVRQRAGLLPFFHLVASTNPLMGVATLCGQAGSRVTNEAVTEMVRCPMCDAAQQLMEVGK